MPNSFFYPTIKDLITSDSLPQGLMLDQSAFSELLDSIFYKDYFVYTNRNGDKKIIDITLVSFKDFGFEIPGTGGLKFILNPSASGGSEIPLRITVQLAILKYLKNVNLNNIDASPEKIFECLLDAFGINEKELLDEAITVLLNSEDSLDEFVLMFNSDYGNLISSYTDFDDVYTQVANNQETIAVIYNLLVNSGNLESILGKLKVLFHKWTGELSFDDFYKLFIPKFHTSIVDPIQLALEFPANVLRQVDAMGDPLVSQSGGDVPGRVTTTLASIQYSSESGFEMNFPPTPVFNFTRSEIFRTGFIIDIRDLKLDLSRDSTIPEAIADGRPVDFMGVYALDASVALPKKWFRNPSGATAEIFAHNMLIGTGGISGIFGLRAISSNPNPILPLVGDPNDQNNGFYIGLKLFDVELHMNNFVRTDIQGDVRIPGFEDAQGNPAILDIKAKYDSNGDLSIKASEPQGIEIKIPNVLNLVIKSLTIGKKENKFYIELEGTIKFTNPAIERVIEDPIEIKKLIVWEDGKIELEGGTIPLPKSLSAQVGPAKIGITAIHFGSHQKESGAVTRKYRYFGFDGGVNVNPGGVDAKGKGIKFFYSVDSMSFDAYLQIESLEVSIIIPGNVGSDAATVIIKGFLGMKDVEGDTEYQGGISLALPKVKIAGGAAMKLRPKTPAFIIDVWLEMSMPILLGATGLGIFGFRGLLGIRYVATKAAAGVPDGSWFDYYKALQLEEGVHVNKFEGPNKTKTYSNPFSIGAGVSLATASDSGQTFSMKLFLLLSLPNLLYLEGKANILSERVGLTGDDPMFFAFIALTNESVETGFGADYKIQQGEGDILALYVEIQAAYFFHNSSAWYVNFGTKQKPITARIFSLFDATSYLMISATGIEAGAKISYEFNKVYVGVVKAYVNVYMEVAGWVSFERPQIGGYIGLGGTVDVSLFGVGFYLSLITSLSVEVPKPFVIKGSVELCVGVKILFKEIEKCFSVNFIWEKDPSPDYTAVALFPQSAAEELPAKAVNIHSGEIFNLCNLGNSVPAINDSRFDTAVIPIDSYIDIEFKKGLIPNAVAGKIGGVTNAPEEYIDLIPPQATEHQVSHAYQIEEINIKIRHGSNWIDYNPYEAMSPPAALSILNSNPENYKAGYWQKTGGKYNKIRLLAQTPLSYVNSGEPGWSIPEELGMTSGSIFCRSRERTKTCLRWNDVFASYLPNRLYNKEQSLFKVVNGLGNVMNFSNVFGIPQSLWFKNESRFEIYLPEPCLDVEIKMFTYSSGVIINYYKEVVNGNSVQYQLVKTENKNRYSLLSPVIYQSIDTAIKKITIDPLRPDMNRITQLSVEIASLTAQLYENPKLNFCDANNIKQQISDKQKEIEKEKSIGCINEEPNKEKLKELIAHYTYELKKCRRDTISFGERLKKVYTEIKNFTLKSYFAFTDYIKLLTNKSHKYPDPNGKITYTTNPVLEKLNSFEFATGKYGNKIENAKSGKRCTEIENILNELKKVMETIGRYKRPEGEARCSTLIHQICWLSVIDSQYNSIIPSQAAIQADYENMVEGIENTLSPIWRPNSQYYIQLKVTDIVAGNATAGQDLFFGFKTAGPLGHFYYNQNSFYTDIEATPQVGSTDNPDLFSLTSLKSYIDYSKSYPNADGDLINAKPLFYQVSKLLLFYTERYIYHMFSGWPEYQTMLPLTGSLEVVIKDPVEDVSIPYPIPPTLDTVPQTQTVWNNEAAIPITDPFIPQDVNLISNLANPSLINDDFEGIVCITTNGDPIIPPRFYTQLIPQYLKPLKLYTAIYFNKFEGVSTEVHKMVFQTSRYANLTEQVNSYLLQDTSGNSFNAVFEISVDVTLSDVNLAYDIIMGNQSVYSSQYPDLFDQLILGALKIQFPPAAISTEFNVIRDSNSNNIIGIWIRNPEPFNDPKIPDAVTNSDFPIKETISIITGGNADTSYNQLFSKDRSQCFIMNDTKNIIPGDFIFRFIYLEWNGDRYIAADTVITAPVTIN